MLAFPEPLRIPGIANVADRGTLVLELEQIMDNSLSLSTHFTSTTITDLMKLYNEL